MAKSERLPVTICWHCDRPLGAADPLESGRPHEGAISLCLYCGAVAFFGPDLRLLMPTKEQLDRLGKDREFRNQYAVFLWGRQYVMIKHNLMREDDADQDH